MGKRDQVAVMSMVAEAITAADDLVEPWRRQELFQGDFPHRDDQFRLENFHLLLEPMGAVSNLRQRRHPIATRDLLSRKATTDRSHVNGRAKLCFAQPTSLMKPAE